MDRCRHHLAVISKRTACSDRPTHSRSGLGQIVRLRQIVGLLLVLTFAPLASLCAQNTVLTHTFKNSKDTEIRITRIFDGNLPRGFEPYRVTVRNQLAKPLQFRISFNFDASYSEEASFGSDFSLIADPNSESVHELLVPVAPIAGRGSYYYSNGVISVNAMGLGTTHTSTSGGRSRDHPAIGISEAVANGNLTALKKIYETAGGGSASYSNTGFAMTFDPAMLPGDWRGYSGLDALMISADEWRVLQPAAQQAVLEWVRLGGRLSVFTDTPETIKSLGLSIGQRSLGSIESRIWTGNSSPKTFDAQKIYDAFSKIEPRVQRVADDYRSNWKLQKEFPDKAFHTALIVILLIAFGVVVGPINLFVFAKAGKRHRLFVTTPLISVIASVLISALILLSDGLGGSGIRLMYVDLQPDPSERKSYLVQEQFSRCGVLLNNAFTLDESAVPSPVELRKSRWNRGVANDLKLAGRNFSGDWFLSRSEQGQLIEAVRPARSRVELRRAASGDAPPVLFSSVDFELKSLHYIDAGGEFWKAKDNSILAGESIELVKIERKAFVDWWKENTELFSSTLRKKLRALPTQDDQRSSLFALSSDPKVGFIETSKDIRWKDDRAVIFGKVLPAAGATQ